MPKNKPFIAKGEGQHFYLVHRSQTDAARGNEVEPSEFVLIPADDNGNDARRRLIADAVINGPLGPGEAYARSGMNLEQSRHAVSSSSSSSKSKKKGDHINALGFKNDGYDYEQHLKEIEGPYMDINGKWVNPTPRAQTTLSEAAAEAAADPRPPKSVVHFQLPDEATPSKTEFIRDYNAITIDATLMDEDLHAALFNDTTEEGDDWEELQDDFVAVAMQEPEVPDFDFDAHIAALIKRSERNCVGDGPVRKGGRKKTAPGTGDGDKVGGLSTHAEGDENGDDDDEEDEDDEEEEDSEGQFSSDFEDDDDEGAEAERGTGYTGQSFASRYTANTAAFSTISSKSKFSMERRVIDERRFDAVVDSYNDDEIGYGSESEEDEDDIKLEIDDPLLMSALDEFLQEQKDRVLCEGVLVSKGSRAVPAVVPSAAAAAAAAAESAPDDANLVTADIKRLALEQKEAQLASLAYISEKQDTFDDIRTCQEYLREEREVEEWDCESVLSTYSTLDNHPSLIREPGSSKFRQHKNRIQREHEASIIDSNKSYDGKAKLVEAHAGSKPLGRIELSGKLSLPLGYGLGIHSNTKRKDGGPGSVAGSADRSRREGTESVRQKERNLKSSAAPPRLLEGDEGEEEDDDDEDGSGSGSGSDDEDNDTRATGFTLTSRKGETPEEKKIRKALVKEDRRTKRANKKAMREIYKDEGVKNIIAIGRKQEIDHISVFRYTK